MRVARFKAPEGTEVAYYHALSRIVDRRWVLGDAEKKVFLQIMRRYERLCGVRVLTYCLMDNHVERFGKRRKEGARRMRGGPEGMFVLRDLRGR